MWSLVPETEVREEHWENWQSLNDRYYSSHPLLDKKFIQPLLDCFSDNNVILAIEKDAGMVRAMVLLEQIGISNWQLFSPSQAVIAPFIFNPDIELDSLIQGLITALPGKALLLALRKLDPGFQHLQPLIKKEYTEYLECAQTINIRIDGDFDSYWKGRGKKIRQNIKRALTKLENDGLTPSFVALSEHSKMVDAITTHGRLESAGWKGAEGTAIHNDNIQGKFYIAVFENFSKEDRACVYNIELNGKPIASLLTITQNGMMVVLKTTYDESMASYSPGRIIDYFMLRQLFTESDVKNVEWYTNASSVDCKWGTEDRIIYNLNCYRSKNVKNIISAVRKAKNHASIILGKFRKNKN